MMTAHATPPQPRPARRRIQLAALALFLMMAIAAVGLFTLGGRAVQLSGQVATLTERQQQLTTELARLGNDKEKLDAELAALEQRRVQLQAEISVLNTTLGYVRKTDPQATAIAESRAGEIARVYIQVASDESAKLAETLSKQLRDAGFVVPRIERVRAVPRQPQLRYFSNDEKPQAERALAIVRRQLPNASVVFFTPYDTPSRMRANHLELWF